MDGRISRLMVLFDAGASSAKLCAVAGTLLSAADDAGSQAETLAEATLAWRAIEVSCRNAFRRFPGPSSQPDVRALVLFETLTVVRNAGLYQPGDLAREPEAAEWVAGECLRLHALAIVLRSAMRELETGTMDAMGYREAVAEYAGQFAHFTVGRGDGDQATI